MFPETSPAPGIRRRVLTDDPALMLVSFRFETGALGALHSHPHVQASYVQSGRFRFTVDGTRTEIGPGQTLNIPSGAAHDCLCLEAGELIDSFSPRRDDFL